MLDLPVICLSKCRRKERKPGWVSVVLDFGHRSSIVTSVGETETDSLPGRHVILEMSCEGVGSAGATRSCRKGTGHGEPRALQELLRFRVPFSQSVGGRHSHGRGQCAETCAPLSGCYCWNPRLPKAASALTLSSRCLRSPSDSAVPPELQPRKRVWLGAGRLDPGAQHGAL